MTAPGAQPRSRPLSPHLDVYKWGPHMLASTLHRLTGIVLATLGTLMFVAWLVALAGGPESYAVFHYWVVSASDRAAAGMAANIAARIVAIGLSWAFFQHMANGIRHFVMDMGAGYELKANRTGALATFAVSIALTSIIWTIIFVGEAR